MKTLQYSQIIALFFASLLAACIGLGISFHNYLIPMNAQNEFTGIHPDNWTEDGATISLKNLYQRGNRLLLTFDSWRPAGLDPAHVKISVCGEVVKEAKIEIPRQQELISLRGSCEPREIKFQMLNPFTPHEGERRVGVKLLSAEVTSRISLPIINVALYFQVTLAVFFLSLIFFWFFTRLSIAPLAFLLPLFSFILIKNANNLNLAKPYPLWILAICFGAGLLLASKLRFLQRQTLISEWDTRNTSSRTWAVLAILVTIFAGIYRFYGLTFGLPSNFHPDEVPKVNAIMRMVDSGTLNPQYFLHPSLLLYSTYFVNNIFHWLGLFAEPFRDTAFLAGRTVSATAGTLSVFLVYKIARRLYSAEVGVASALLLAVFPLHVTCSRYLKEDALLLFWILSCILALLVAVQDKKNFYLLLAGLFAGFSASTKYSGLLMGAVVALAPWLRSRSLKPDIETFKWLIPAFGLMPVGFVLCTPYSILDFAKFSKDFNSERHHMARGHTNTVDAWSQYWMYHFSRSIVPGMSMVTTAFSVLAMGVLIWRRRVEDLFLIAMIFFFYLPAEYVKAKPAPQPERYILPCLPFLAIACAEALRILMSSRARLLAIFLFPVLIFFPLYRTTQISSEIKNDTRLQIAHWMKENLEPGAKVYLDWKPYCPRFFNDEFQVTYIPRSEIISELEVGKLKRSGYDYLVLSSLFYGRYFTEPNSSPSIRQRFRDLFDRVPIVKEFSPKYGSYGFHNPTLTLFSLKQGDFEKINQELALRAQGKLAQTSNQAKASFRWKEQGGLVLR